jgi:hypothetical protein
MTNPVAWMAFAVSVVSALISGYAFWVDREKLRLELYAKRFDIYTRSVDFWHLFTEWICPPPSNTRTFLSRTLRS